MSGHSKWSTIKHKKAKEDAKRGKAFTKLIKEITIAARDGGGDPASNARLRLLMEKAKEINMPQDNTMRAIKKGTGELPGQIIEEITFEGYGPNGIAVIVDIITDNRNRAVADLRHIFSSKGGNLGESGSVAWMFEKLGVVRATGSTSEDQLLEALLDYDIQDIKQDENFFSVFCEPHSLEAVKQKIKDLGLHIDSADLEWVPKQTTELSKDQEDKAYTFLSALQDHDDVQNVYTNLI